MDVDEDFEMASASSDHRMCPPTTPRGRGITRGGTRGRGRGYQPGFSSCATSSIREDVDLEAVRGRGRGGGVRGGRGGRGRPPCVTPGYTANERLKNRKDACGFIRTSEPFVKDRNANNPYKIDRRQKPQMGAPSDNPHPEMSDGGQDNKCICMRPPKRVTCTVCGYYVEGRLVRPCECHPQVTYLLDINCCPQCQSAWRYLREMEFPSGYRAQ